MPNFWALKNESDTEKVNLIKKISFEHAPHLF